MTKALALQTALDSEGLADASMERVMAMEEALALKVALIGRHGAVHHSARLCELYNHISCDWINAGAAGVGSC